MIQPTRLILAVTLAACAAGGSGRQATAAPSSETKLIGGPLVFRVTGSQRLPVKYTERRYRYVFVWKLDRDLHVRVHDHDRADSPFGTYIVLHKIHISGDGAPFRIMAPAGCLASYVGTDSSYSQTKLLNGVPTGQKLSVRLQPTNQTDPSGPAMLGKVYVVSATMRKTDVLFGEPEARRQLARIGCDLHGHRLIPPNSS